MFTNSMSNNIRPAMTECINGATLRFSKKKVGLGKV